MNAVVETREKLKMTQVELARLLLKHPRTVAGWEAQPEIEDRVLLLAMDRLADAEEPYPWDRQDPG